MKSSFEVQSARGDYQVVVPSYIEKDGGIALDIQQQGCVQEVIANGRTQWVCGPGQMPDNFSQQVPTPVSSGPLPTPETQRSEVAPSNTVAPAAPLVSTNATTAEAGMGCATLAFGAVMVWAAVEAIGFMSRVGAAKKEEENKDKDKK